MTRTGKIARLPREIREQLNRRLSDGEKGRKLVRWLNSLPSVQAVLKAEFAGRPINETNLTEWKLGGYRDWLNQQEAREFVTRLANEAEELNPATGPPLTDRMAGWLAAHLMVVVRRLSAADLDDTAKWKLLHEAAGDIAAFRKGDHTCQRLKLDREWLELDREQFDLDRERVAIERGRSIDAVVNMLMSPARKDPRLLDAAIMLCGAIAKDADPAVKHCLLPSERESPWASAAREVVQSSAPTESNQIKVNQTK